MSKQLLTRHNFLYLTTMLGFLGVNFLIPPPAFSQISQTIETYITPSGNVINIATPQNIFLSPDGRRITTPTGTITSNTSFIVTENGYITSATSTIVTPNGLMISGDGRRISTPVNSVTSDGVFVAIPNGSFVIPAGTLINPNGIISPH